MPATTELLIALFLSGVVSSGITEVVKLWCRKMRKGEESDPAWWQGLFRLVPILVGAGMGTFFFDMPWGVSVGATGGALSVVLYKRAKSFVQNIRSPQG